MSNCIYWLHALRLVIAEALRMELRVRNTPYSAKSSLFLFTVSTIHGPAWARSPCRHPSVFEDISHVYMVFIRCVAALPCPSFVVTQRNPT